MVRMVQFSCSDEHGSQSERSQSIGHRQESGAISSDNSSVDVSHVSSASTMISLPSEFPRLTTVLPPEQQVECKVTQKCKYQIWSEIKTVLGNDELHLSKLR